MEYFNPLFPIIFVIVGNDNVKANPEKSSQKFVSYEPFIDQLNDEIKKTYPNWDFNDVINKEEYKDILDRKCKRVRKITYTPEYLDLFNLSNNQNENKLHVINDKEKEMLLDVLLGKNVRIQQSISIAAASNENQVKYEAIVNAFENLWNGISKPTNAVIYGEYLIPNSNNTIRRYYRESILLLLLLI